VKNRCFEDEGLQNFTQVGSNAAEYIKIMPGFAVQNGTSNNQTTPASHRHNAHGEAAARAAEQRLHLQRAP